MRADGGEEGAGVGVGGWKTAQKHRRVRQGGEWRTLSRSWVGWPGNCRGVGLGYSGSAVEQLKAHDSSFFPAICISIRSTTHIYLYPGHRIIYFKNHWNTGNDSW